MSDGYRLIECPKCGKEGRVPDGITGKVTCPGCGAKFVVAEPLPIDTGPELVGAFKPNGSQAKPSTITIDLSNAPRWFKVVRTRIRLIQWTLKAFSVTSLTLAVYIAWIVYMQFSHTWDEKAGMARPPEYRLPLWAVILTFLENDLTTLATKATVVFLAMSCACESTLALMRLSRSQDRP